MWETPLQFLGKEDLLDKGRDILPTPVFLGSAGKKFIVAQVVKNPPAMRETLVWSLGWEDPLEKGKATHSSILSGEFHGLQSMGHKRLDTTE